MHSQVIQLLCNAIKRFEIYFKEAQQNYKMDLLSL